MRRKRHTADRFRDATHRAAFTNTLTLFSNDVLYEWFRDWCEPPLDEIDLVAMDELNRRITDGRVTLLPDDIALLLMELAA